MGEVGGEGGREVGNGGRREGGVGDLGCWGKEESREFREGGREGRKWGGRKVVEGGRWGREGR